MEHLVRGLLLPCVVTAAVAQSFVNHESGPVQPLRLSADGTRLFVADTVGARLCVFDLSNPSAPFLIAEIPVGLDPVSVNPRTRDEVWVTNVLSDCVSIVSVAARRVIDTLHVVDEPSDVVFAGGKAFVSAATVDEVRVFDAVTRAPLGSVAIYGKDPRALAVSADGAHVYAVVQRSGNGTTLLPDSVAPPQLLPPLSPLPPPPHVGMIVRADNPAWAAYLPYWLPDHDVADIDVVSLTVTRYFDHVGTTNTAIAVHPGTGDLWVANTEARNLVAFEPQLRGHVIDSRVTRITTGVAPAVTPFDLNPGVNYTQLPNANALASALSEPFGVVVDGAANVVYVTAQGTDRIGVVDANGAVVAAIEVGNTPGVLVDTRHKRGPRALALHPAAPRLYVLNHLSDTLVVVDTTTRTVLREQPIATIDPMPVSMREGRRFLYDAKLSGNGTMSCASCHIDSDTDGLSWNLGDPYGAMVNPPSQPLNPFNSLLVPYHPMKGPLTTQTLRGLDGVGVLHWRGDRADFQAFNGAFDTLLGGAQLPTADLDDLAAFGMAITLPPNPNQQLDRSLRTSPAGNNEAAGLVAFQASVSLPQLGTIRCASCHALPLGTNGFVINAGTIAEPQQMKVAQLRTLYRKLGLERAPGPQKAGFGFRKDGEAGTLTEFLNIPQFSFWPAATKDDIATFLLSFDTGTAPLVGYQFVVDAANVGSAAVAADFALVTARAAAGDIDVTVHGTLDGRLAGLLYDPVTTNFVSDRSGDGPFTQGQLLTKVIAGSAEFVFTAVTPGEGTRFALDRDLDLVPDGDEAAVGYGAGTAGCAGLPRLTVNSEPRLDNLSFGCVMENAPPASIGMLVLAYGSNSIQVLGIEILVDPLTAVIAGVNSDAFGGSVFPLAIPDQAGLVGLGLFGQAIWLDACGTDLLSSSAGVHFVVGA